MCGIAGKAYFNNKEVLVRDIEAMNEKITHRGPDDSGVYISKNKRVGMGHRRLSVIDLSPLGHQPMNYLNRYWISYNGEIYNFQILREKLKKDGYQFKSKTDTEVILALYDKYGKKCLDHLRGMFAFVIFDEKENTIFAARDRVGKKPFKYYLDENVFIFASELKSILTQKEYIKEPDWTAIHHYLTLQYCPAPLTGFKGIKKLEPGHYLFLNLNGKKIIKEQYWKLDYSKKMKLTEDEWSRKINGKLEESVKLRMVSDVPLGAFLSGGIDSSAIVGIMSKFSKTPIKTFSIGFEEKKYNELKYARKIADLFKTDHTEFIVKPNALEDLRMLAKQYEEPFADSSALPTCYLSKLTKEHVTVALNGDGGDENFAGYSRYSAFKLSLLYAKLGLINKAMVLPATKMLANNTNNPFFARAHRFSKSASDDYRSRYLEYIAYFNNEDKESLYTDNFKNQVWPEDTYKIIAEKFNGANIKNKIDQVLYTDFVSYLPDDLLAKIDIASMAVSLECRSPLLDHKFLELTAKVPPELKLSGLTNKKYIFKKALENFIPNEILYRPKMGFGVPINTWFRNDLESFTKQTLLSKKATSRSLFKKKEISRLLSEHARGMDHQYRIWALLMLELWLEEYFG
ncbi:asparagine synthase (glutamine-hydrolyzing) [bacterium CG2_30_37_16]|nr:MAG: asparagine synthase (glutamine-hydrolyzing) [bacterium CG2_30_37_16]PIP30409.1 MAG: asparagine synthase (glutamine-hydrolyzing) [bacterium (Candidatus Howlettbacteria) CG23_combo_of_CG06-09_8_20_14_all_37_9]